ncbi:NADP-dependent oxidoreductase [Isoptericola sp. NPDC056578]|uniref:NADP-dependent oxidoreductase n=1 Tax=Isoptericola sp. NPDC056578 TaxID=3345870 RepID=UPI0036C35566
MRAVRYSRYGDSDVLGVQEVGAPAPGPGEVLVQVAGTTFNPVDAGIRAGGLAQVFPLTFPHTPGIDVAGTVVAVGDGVIVPAVGQAVIGFLPMNEDGAAAELVVAPAAALVAAPRSVDLADAAALPVGGLTAWQALFDAAGFEAGWRVFVHGAEGSVGGYAVQLAHQAGAHVTATAGDRSAARLTAYGADELVPRLDLGSSPLSVPGAPFDVVLNLVGTSPAQTAALADLVADGGALVSTTTPPPPEAGRGIRTARVFLESRADQLAALVERVDAGDLAVHVAARRPLADLRAVHEEAAAGRLAGKTVLVP